jgi:hypothetical protein
MSAAAFISRWSNASPSERANSQLFLSEICDLLGVPHPDAEILDALCTLGHARKGKTKGTFLS